MKRYELVDTLRGISILSMIAFHTCWLLNYFRIAVPTAMLYGKGFLIWERTICIAFIMISGFSFSFGHRHIRIGLELFLLGLAITALTCMFLPDIRIVFGILTFLGSATLIMIPIDKAYHKASKGDNASEPVNVMLLTISLLLFVLTYNINIGYLGIRGVWSANLPQVLYKGYPATFIGFMEPGFVSTDYFSVIPWLFIYLYGYFLHKAVMGSPRGVNTLNRGISPISFLGRHSLIIYLIHPIVIYLILYFARYLK